MNFTEPNQTIAIFGAGLSGLALFENFQFLPYRPILIDKNRPREIANEYYYSDSVKLADLPQPSLVIKSPGISPEHPLLQQFAKAGIAILSEIEWSARFFNGQIYAITGTDGKSTTTALAGHLLNAPIGGNIGLPFAKYCQQKMARTILELSSYQLEDSQNLTIQCGILLNIARDHMERHKTMANYLLAKLKIIDFLAEDGLFICHSELKGRIEKQKPLPKNSLFFSHSQPADAFISTNTIQTGQHSYSTKPFALKGTHNLENLAAAILMAEWTGVQPGQIEQRIATFRGLDYRFQSLGEIGGCHYINDSKATNLNSTLAGLKGWPKEKALILILGGRPKKEPIQPLIERLNQLNSTVYLIGEAVANWQKEFQDGFNGSFFSYEHLDDVFQDLKIKKNTLKSKTILFSPACASFDQYKNFEQRGQDFNRLIQKYMS